MYEHLLVALDGSPAAERVLEHAETLAKAFGSTVTLLRATLSPEMVILETTAGGDVTGADIGPGLDPEPIVEADETSAADYLEAIASRLRQHNLTVNVEHPEGRAADVIIERAKALNASMILMTTHGRGGLGRVVFGSVADAVLRHALCPVLLVRISQEGER